MLKPPGQRRQEKMTAITAWAELHYPQDTALAARTVEILLDQLGINLGTVHPGTRFAEIYLDSLGTVELVMALEEVFQLTISDEDAMAILTFDDLMAYLRQREG